MGKKDSATTAQELPVRMLHDRVLVSLEMEGDRRSGGGILIPATASVGKRLAWGEVVATEPNVRQVQLAARVHVDPEERAKGHGSRLLQAAADTMVADRFTQAVTWVLAGDDALLSFLTDAGWAADSAPRELDPAGTGATRGQLATR